MSVRNTQLHKILIKINTTWEGVIWDNFVYTVKMETYNEVKYIFEQGRANKGMQGVPCTRVAEIKERQFLFYVWQSCISVLCYETAFIIWHQGGISTGRGPVFEYICYRQNAEWVKNLKLVKLVSPKSLIQNSFQLKLILLFLNFLEKFSIHWQISVEMRINEER